MDRETSTSVTYVQFIFSRGGHVIVARAMMMIMMTMLMMLITHNSSSILSFD